MGDATPTRRSLAGAQRALGAAERSLRIALRPLARTGFPWRAPTVPRGVTVPEEPSELGADYDTSWAREPLPTVVRGVVAAGPLRLLTRVLARTEVTGLDRLADLARLETPPAVIFAPNHHSHLDTAVMIRSIPAVWRRDLVVAAAADYFFDRRWKAALSALALNAIPIDREGTGRRSADLIRSLMEDGSSLLIYPEGGRSPDGWGQDFKGGAAYLASRTGSPVIPVFIDGTGRIFGKGMRRPRRGRARVVFGSPLWPSDDESTRRLNSRIEAAVGRLADESMSDYWAAARRSAEGTTPALTGPGVTGWRRAWQLTEFRRAGVAGSRTRAERAWPDLGRRRP
jgi:1-acyl-sn-glycerol-3-phosphate acyltransferase